MASAKNKVIAGAYNGYVVQHSSKDIFLCPSTFSMDMTRLNKQTVDSYDLITEDKVKSGSSAILRGAVGAAVLGPVGLLAGLSAKNKGIYTIAIQWKNGNQSLIEIDDVKYKSFVKGMF